MKKIYLLLTFLLMCCTTKTEIVYRNVYPDVPELKSPLILKLSSCHFVVPFEDEHIYLGLDEKNFKCYLKNQEQTREQILLYEKFIQEINKERVEWKKMNQQ